MGGVGEQSNKKNENIEEKGSGVDKKVKSSVDGCADSSKHSKKPHPEQYSKTEEYKIQGYGAGSKYMV